MDSMEDYLKGFFGPGRKDVVAKIIMGLLLFLLVTYIYSATWQVADYWAVGWPLHFSETWGPCFGDAVCERSNYFALAFDIVFWYLVFCLIDFVHHLATE